VGWVRRGVFLACVIPLVDYLSCDFLRDYIQGVDHEVVF